MLMEPLLTTARNFEELLVHVKEQSESYLIEKVSLAVEDIDAKYLEYKERNLSQNFTEILFDINESASNLLTGKILEKFKATLGGCVEGREGADLETLRIILKSTCIDCLDLLRSLRRKFSADMDAFIEYRTVSHRQSFRLLIPYKHIFVAFLFCCSPTLLFLTNTMRKLKACSYTMNSRIPFITKFVFNLNNIRKHYTDRQGIPFIL